MREILFRGKSSENGEWIYGSLIKRSIGSFIVDEANKCSLQCCGEYDFHFNSKLVKSETVGQYTGLTDKNGKKIFEGDILKAMTVDTNAERFAVVGFGSFVDDNNDDEYLGFYIEFDGIKTTASQLSEESVKCHFEVIGNIHDNPEC